jgi:rhamnose utilization protein RhaD (predicted bifunctional aldolase and dehydrogenase)
VAKNDPIQVKVQQFCADISQDRTWVQAAGGNVSWKTNTELWIKASGTWLADAQKKSIFVPVERALLADALGRGDYSFTPRALDGHTLRPSIETMLHALMPQQIVVHLHLVDAVARLVRQECDAEITSALGDDFAWALVDYHKPGADLARAIHAQIVLDPKIQVVLLKNHGLIVAADTVEDVYKLLSELSERFELKPRNINAKPALPLVSSQVSLLSASGYEPCKDEYLNDLVLDPHLYQRLKDSWSICPDHVVFLGADAICLDDLADLPRCMQTLEPETPFIFIKGQGIHQILGVTPAKLAQLMFYLDVSLRQPVDHPMVCLKPEEVSSLLNWDAEIYRQKIII